jgi:arylsulfatase A-like enzyme
MADDMRSDDLKYTPLLRRLFAKRGLTFMNSFSPFPLCCPARASFLTGTYAHNHRVYWHDRPYGYGVFDDSRTIATSLRRAGYNTGFVGKYLNGYGRDRSLVRHGPSWNYVPRGWTDWRAAFTNPGLARIHGDVPHYYDTPYNINGRLDNSHRGEYQPVVVADFATRMSQRFSVSRRQSGKRFFMYVNFTSPHNGGPNESDDPAAVRRGAARFAFGTPARPDWVKGRFDHIRRASGLPRSGGPAEANMRDKRDDMRRLPEPNRRERSAMAEVTRQRAEALFVMDRQIARLVRQLKASRQWRRTFFVFTSDNGYFLGEHRLRPQKARTYEPSLRVPILVTGPRMRQGERRYDPISLVDLSATILDAAGARPPRPTDGQSRLVTMRRGDQGWAHPEVTEFFLPPRRRPRDNVISDERFAVGVRVARYSYIKYRSFEELYDLRTDPFQDRNVASRSRYAEVRRQLLQLVRETADCAGPACLVPMPDSLAATPTEERELTLNWWRAMGRRYGW